MICGGLPLVLAWLITSVLVTGFSPVGVWMYTTWGTALVAPRSCTAPVLPVFGSVNWIELLDEFGICTTVGLVPTWTCDVLTWTPEESVSWSCDGLDTFRSELPSRFVVLELEPMCTWIIELRDWFVFCNIGIDGNPGLEYWIFWLAAGIWRGTLIVSPADSCTGTLVVPDTCIGRLTGVIKGTPLLGPDNWTGTLMLDVDPGICTGTWTVDSCSGYGLLLVWILTGAMEWVTKLCVIGIELCGACTEDNIMLLEVGACNAENNVSKGKSEYLLLILHKDFFFNSRVKYLATHCAVCYSATDSHWKKRSLISVIFFSKFLFWSHQSFEVNYTAFSPFLSHEHVSDLITDTWLS